MDELNFDIESTNDPFEKRLNINTMGAVNLSRSDPHGGWWEYEVKDEDAQTFEEYIGEIRHLE